MPGNNLPLECLLTVHRKLRVPHCQQCHVESGPDKIEASWGRCQVDQQLFVRAKTKKTKSSTRPEMTFYEEKINRRLPKQVIS